MNGCPFCALEQSRIVGHCESALAIRDAFPVTDGHTLVVPRVHVKSIFDLNGQDQAAIWAFVAEIREALVREFGVTSFTVGVNDGESAGQTVEHAHIHLIPRRKGDVADPRGGVRHVIPPKARYWGEN
jgi:diadenosine tetraphosphate (Ap4A) HIT family hydrolase